MRRLQGNWVYVLAFVVISSGWTLVSLLGFLDDAEQWSLNARYKLRGPLESSAKVVYVNRDITASNEFGRGWFPRDYYALAGEALFELGNARALFFDIVLTSDHLPKAEAPALNYSGNLKMQRFLLKYPDKVVLAAAYDGTAYPFSPYRSFLPDTVDGKWVEDGFGWKGYDSEKNPLPALPEYPMWYPKVTDQEASGLPIGEVGLINTSDSLNRNNYVQWVPAHVLVSNAQPALFLANGMTRWQNSIVDLTGQGRRVKATPNGDHYDVVDEEGRKWNEVPAKMDVHILAAALRLAEFGLGGVHWEFGGDTATLIGDNDNTLRKIPLKKGQHVAINWFSGWRSHPLKAPNGGNLQTSAWGEWMFLDVARNREQWCAEVEAGVKTAVEPFRAWAFPNDLYNPSVSIAEVLILYDAYLYAEEMNYPKVQALIKGVFSQFSDAYIMVGSTDPLLQDLGPNPFDDDITPQVAVHGNLLKTIIDDRHLWFVPASYLPALIFALTFLIVLSLFEYNAETRWHWIVAPFLLFGFGVCSVYLFAREDIVIPAVGPLCSGISATAFAFGWRLWKEESQRLRLKRLFGTYVSPDVVNMMVEAEEDPKLGGNERTITAFFSDIVSFTSMSEQLSAADVVELINVYVEEMTSILIREKGTLDKYIGDAIVGIFNAPHDLPDHAARACITALAFSEAQRKLCIDWRTGERRFPELVCQMRTRIGLHTGTAVVGNMGSNQRFSYTMMGDSVNLAARLEQAGKVYGVDVVVSESTKDEALKDEPSFIFRILDVAKVKGRETSVRIYELVGVKPYMSENDIRCIEIFEEGYLAFEASDLLSAKELFASALKLERSPGDLNPSRLYLSRCNQMLDTGV